MKKLRLTNEEKTNIIEYIKEKWLNNKQLSINDIKLDDIKKDINEYCAQNVIKPAIYITSDAYVKMLELIRMSDVEISWHGLVKKDKEIETYLIYDILVFPQVNTATTTSADEEKFAKWQTKLISDPNFPLEDLRMHGHSHVEMDVFSSGVDDKYQEDLLKKVENGDYYIFLIMNKYMEMCALLYDFDQQMLFINNDIDIDIIGKNNELLTSWADKEITENCEEVKISYGTMNTRYFNEDYYYSGYNKKGMKKYGSK